MEGWRPMVKMMLGGSMTLKKVAGRRGDWRGSYMLKVGKRKGYRK